MTKNVPMQLSSNSHENSLVDYRARFAQALVEATQLGFTRPSFVSERTRIGNEVLRTVTGMMNSFSEFLGTICPGYWGNSCQTLSTNIFAFLNVEGIPAEIVIGEVNINGTNEFDTTVDLIRNEVLGTKPLEGPQSVHAWISLGDDTIVDAALPPRLAKYYGMPDHFNDMIFIGRAEELLARYRVRYEPIVVGSEFFAKTNPPDPMRLLQAWQNGRA